MRVLAYPDPFLRRKVNPVKEISGQLREGIAEMFLTMYEAKGVGLAATQVGLDEAVFVLNLKGDPSGEQVFINPELVAIDGDRCEIEGCLSVPGLEAKVRRGAHVHVRALDIDGNPFEVEGADLMARVLQHELDHLAGTLFIDKVGPATRIGLRSRLKELEERYGALNER